MDVWVRGGGLRLQGWRALSSWHGPRLQLLFFSHKLKNLCLRFQLSLLCLGLGDNLSDAGRDWGQEEKGMTEDEMAGWHH